MSITPYCAGGLMPLTSAGCYGQPPVTSSGRRSSSASLASSQGNLRPRRVKTYAAYSVSKSVQNTIHKQIKMINHALIAETAQCTAQL